MPMVRVSNGGTAETELIYSSVGRNSSGTVYTTKPHNKIIISTSNVAGYETVSVNGVALSPVYNGAAYMGCGLAVFSLEGDFPANTSIYVADRGGGITIYFSVVGI